MRAYLPRLVVVFLIALAATFIVNEGAYWLQRDSSERAAGVVKLVIPAGTAERVAQGEPMPSIPNTLSFVIGDTLQVENQDSVSHQLGPIFVPPHSTGSLVLKEANHFAMSCSFTPSRYLGLDVRPATDLSVRLAALTFAAPTLTAFLFIYSLLVFPIKPDRVTTERKP